MVDGNSQSVRTATTCPDFSSGQKFHSEATASPTVKAGGVEGLVFAKAEHGFVAAASAKKAKIGEELVIGLPELPAKSVAVEKRVKPEAAPTGSKVEEKPPAVEKLGKPEAPPKVEEKPAAEKPTKLEQPKVEQRPPAAEMPARPEAQKAPDRPAAERRPAQPERKPEAKECGRPGLPPCPR